MTKFERAKKQTLRKLEAIVLFDLDNEPFEWIYCGFCNEYEEIGTKGDICGGCPLRIIENCACYRTKWWRIWRRSKSEAQFLFALALYGWIESLHE